MSDKENQKKPAEPKKPTDPKNPFDKTPNVTIVTRKAPTPSKYIITKRKGKIG